MKMMLYNSFNAMSSDEAVEEMKFIADLLRAIGCDADADKVKNAIDRVESQSFFPQPFQVQ